LALALARSNWPANGLAWAADSRSLLYVVTDPAYRPHEVWRHELGTAPSRDSLVYREDDERFELRVRDDGQGIEPDALREGVEGHYGLHGMHERARVIGATLSVGSGPGAGTDVHLSVPASRAYLRRRRWSWRRTAEPV